jgi:error-prone DNA polymerase
MPNPDDHVKPWKYGNTEDTTPPPHPPTAIRLGLRLVAGLSEDDIKAIEAARAERPFESLLDFCMRVPLSRDKVENLILCGAFDSLHEHRRGLLWRLDETLSLANTYRGWGEKLTIDNCQLSIVNSKAVPHITTPIAWDLDDFSPWDKFLWTWRITGVTAEAHVFAHLRDKLKKRGIITAYEALRQKPGTRVTVAGLNIRPHRPRTVSGNPVLFSIVEDETEMLQSTVLGDAIWETTTVFLTSPAVLVRGVMERRGNGSSLMLEKAKPLRFQDYAPEEDAELIAPPPATRTYTGTKIKTEVTARALAHNT